MIVKMLAHYHGRLSADRHLEAGQTVTVTEEVGAELIRRGLAAPVEEAEPKPAPPKRGKAGQTS